tara:strand:- start:815 stop:1264 length:450 start_codon:yes stop_codon:yes gene_type:complete
MIIVCPNCNKKFEIDQNLVPNKGRLLQCGSCNHKWFFSIDKIKEKVNEDKVTIENKSNLDIKTKGTDKIIKDNIDIEAEDIYKSKKKEKKNINYLNILLVIIISFIAIILVLDTFKNQLVSVIPNINFLLDNLYQSIEDIKLFIKDLIK